MSVEINLLAVVLATLASMIVGSIWYAPPVFGGMWMRLIGKKPKDMEQNGWKPIFIAIATSVVTAYVLAHFTFIAFDFYSGDYSFLSTALITASWAWLGFTAVRLLTHDSFEGRPLKLTALNVAHELVTFLAMGLAIGMVGV